MLLINLIAARRAERRKLELIRGVIARAMVGVGLATALGLAFMLFSIQITRSRIDDVDQQMRMLQPTVDTVNQINGDMDALKPRVTTLLKAQNATNRWRAVLQEVSASLPQKMWLTSFSSQEGDTEGFSVTGQTRSQALVGSAMLRLNRQTYIQGVDLRYTQSGGTDGVVNFELAGTLKPTEEPAEAPKDQPKKGAPRGK